MSYDGFGPFFAPASLSTPWASYRSTGMHSLRTAKAEMRQDPPSLHDLHQVSKTWQASTHPLHPPFLNLIHWSYRRTNKYDLQHCRIKKICHYDTPTPSPSDNFLPPTKANEDRQKTSPEWLASSPRTVLYDSAVNLNVPLTSYLYLRDPFRLPEARRSIVNATITRDVSKIVGTVDELKSTALDYFNSIHPWMPVVSRTRFFSRLPQIWLEPQADFILLAFCMFLVIQIPGQDHLENMQSSLYAMAKGLIALIESADILSIEVVQARLLVSIYELGHGIDSGAFISIGACARSGIALGIHRTLQQQAPGDAQSWVELEEQRRVWWGIYILDQ